MSDHLTKEALEQHQNDNVPRQRRRSSIKPEGSESTAPGLVGPNFRRMSRFEPRTSVQYGLAGRRPSQASRRTSVSGTSQGTKHHVIPVRLQNTYRMQPEGKEKFTAGPVEKIMKSVLESYLDGEVYEHKMCANLAQNLSDVIKSRIKDLGFPRYKLVCNVLIGENSSQAVMMTSRCLWNSDTDNFAQARFSKGKLFAIATVFATYFEWRHITEVLSQCNEPGMHLAQYYLSCLDLFIKVCDCLMQYTGISVIINVITLFNKLYMIYSTSSKN